MWIGFRFFSRFVNIFRRAFLHALTHSTSIVVQKLYKQNKRKNSLSNGKRVVLKWIVLRALLLFYFYFPQECGNILLTNNLCPCTVYICLVNQKYRTRIPYVFLSILIYILGWCKKIFTCFLNVDCCVRILASKTHLIWVKMTFGSFQCDKYQFCLKIREITALVVWKNVKLSEFCSNLIQLPVLILLCCCSVKILDA